jgi:CTP synthase (UTP-ammonia lyase)
MSVIKSLEHSAMACKRKLILVLVNASLLQEESKTSSSIEYDKAWEAVKAADGILIPIGFGNRGTEGMLGRRKFLFWVYVSVFKLQSSSMLAICATSLMLGPLNVSLCKILSISLLIDQC